MVKSTGERNITEQNVEVGLFDFYVKPNEEVDEDGDGVAFGCRQEHFRKLSETDHEVAV